MSAQWLARQYGEIWTVDFEYVSSGGERPRPISMVAREFHSRRIIRLWEDDLQRLDAAPFNVGPRSLFVAYFASAEISCFLALDWACPENVLDLFVSFRTRFNGRTPPSGFGLVGALSVFGIPNIGASAKNGMRELILSGGPYSASDRAAILRYNQGDVDGTERLLTFLAPTNEVDLQHALLHGRYMSVSARMEFQGTPIDFELHGRLVKHWDEMKGTLIAAIDKSYGIYEGASFRTERFERYLALNGIRWPRLESGSLRLDSDTFRDMAKAHPQLQSLHELRQTLSGLRLSNLAVGPDGRNRTIYSPFRAKTGRNQPSNAEFIFGPAVWMRGLIRPPRGHAIAYLDWSQQEFGIAAALSGDHAMQRAYLSGDPYLEFAKQAGAVPQHATKKTHAAEREQFKACVLAVQYGMGARSLALRINASEARARELLRLHRVTYATFWEWSDAVVNFAMVRGFLVTRFGWRVNVPPDANTRSVRNFPMQANGAEMLRLACCLGAERGVPICAPVHDAVLIEAPVDEIDEVVAEMAGAMRQASELVLDGFSLRTDAKPYIVRYPERYADPRGQEMWDTMMQLLDELEEET